MEVASPPAPSPSKPNPKAQQQQQKKPRKPRPDTPQKPQGKKPKRRRNGLKQPLTKDMPRALSELLKEPKMALLHRVVKLAGPKLSWQLLRETLRLEREGGQQVNAQASGKPELFFVVDELSHEYKPRRRTSGGVFFRLLREKVPKEVYRTIYEVEDRKKKDAKKKARTRQRQRMDNTLAKLGFDGLTLATEERAGAAETEARASVDEGSSVPIAVSTAAEDGEVAEDMQM